MLTVRVKKILCQASEFCENQFAFAKYLLDILFLLSFSAFVKSTVKNYIKIG